MAEIVLALDVDKEKAAELITKTSAEIDYFKIGQALFAEAPEIIDNINKIGKKVFLDLKYNDIPSVIALAVRKVSERFSPFALTLHISGGRMMLTAAKESAVSMPEGKRPLLFGVTVLTSLETADLKMLGVVPAVNFDLEEYIVRLANFAKECAIDGVVCSGKELKAVRTACGSKFLTLVPGLSTAADQKRTMSVGEAAKSGADYLVIGRMITSAENPGAAAAGIKKEIRNRQNE